MSPQIPRYIVSAVPAVACVALVALSGAAGAQTQKMRPGLWEHAISMKTQSGQMEAAMAQMQKSLASMPPAQRKQMEQMLAQQGVGIGPTGQTVKICITPEQANQDTIPPQDGCTQNIKRTGANTLAMTFSCKGGQDEPPSSGEGTMTFNGPTAYSGNFKVKTMSNGKPEQIDMAQIGKWLAADCGAIKPVK